MSTSRSPRTPLASAHPTRQQLDELDALLERMLDLPVNQVEEEQAGRPGLPEKPASPTRAVAAPPPEPEVVVPRRRGQVREEPEPAREAEPEPPTRGVREDRPVETGRTGLEPRLLQLPVEGEEPEPPPLAVQPPHRLRERSRVEAETPEAANTEAAGDWIPLRSSWKPSPQTWPPLAETWQQAQQTPDTVRIRHDDRAVSGPLSEQARTPDAEEEPAPAWGGPHFVPPTPSVPFPERRPEPEPEPAFRHEKPPAAYEEPPDRPEEPAHREEKPPEPPHDLPEPLQRSWPHSFSSEAEPAVPAPTASSPAAKLKVFAPGVDSEPPVPPALLPLVWFNKAFDGVLSLGGPPGRFLRGRLGRNLLGSLGVLSLVGAFGLAVAHWLGWTW